jgi:hypothetical protein
LTGADFGVDFFFCVAIADIIATTALLWRKSPRNT